VPSRRASLGLALRPSLGPTSPRAPRWRRRSRSTRARGPRERAGLSGPGRRQFRSDLSTAAGAATAVEAAASQLGGRDVLAPTPAVRSGRSTRTSTRLAVGGGAPAPVNGLDCPAAPYRHLEKSDQALIVHSARRVIKQPLDVHPRRTPARRGRGMAKTLATRLAPSILVNVVCLARQKREEKGRIKKRGSREKKNRHRPPARARTTARREPGRPLSNDHSANRTIPAGRIVAPTSSPLRWPSSALRVPIYITGTVAQIYVARCDRSLFLANTSAALSLP